MKRTLLASIIGGILMFIWQFLSWGILNLHEEAQQYTPNQDAIIAALNANLPEEGGYFVPNAPPNASSEEWEKVMKDMEGKPWAVIQYHKSHDMSMGMNITRQLLADILTVWLFCWLLMRLNIRTFGSIFLCSLAVALIVFLNSPYTGSIWFQWFDTTEHLVDALVSWGPVGIWVGLLYNKRPTI